MYHIHSIEPEDDEPQAEQESEREELSEAEFEKLSPEEQLLRAIFGEAPVSKRRTSPPPPVGSGSERITQSEPERVTMRFGFEQPLVPADLAVRVVPTLEAVAHLDQALGNALGATGGDGVQILRIGYGSPLDVQLAPVAQPTVAVIDALAQNEDLSAEEQARLKELQFQLVEAQVASAQLANQEQNLRNAKLQTEIDSLRIQQLVTMFERLFPQLSEPLRLAIIAQHFPELKLLMPPNIQLLFDAEPRDA